MIRLSQNHLLSIIFQLHFFRVYSLKQLLPLQRVLIIVNSYLTWSHSVSYTTPHYSRINLIRAKTLDGELYCYVLCFALSVRVEQTSWQCKLSRFPNISLVGFTNRQWSIRVPKKVSSLKRLCNVCCLQSDHWVVVNHFTKAGNFQLLSKRQVWMPVIHSNSLTCNPCGESCFRLGFIALVLAIIAYHGRCAVIWGSWSMAIYYLLSNSLVRSWL